MVDCILQVKVREYKIKSHPLAADGFLFYAIILRFRVIGLTIYKVDEYKNRFFKTLSTTFNNHQPLTPTPGTN